MAGGVEVKSRRGRKRVMAEINVVPYIDVTLVLLIIFMITAPLVTQSVKVDLPQVDSTVVESTEDEPVNVTIDKAGQIYCDVGSNPEQPIEMEELVTRLAAVMKYKPKTPIYLAGDAGVDYGRVIEVFQGLRAAGVDGVGLRTDSPTGKPKK